MTKRSGMIGIMALGCLGIFGSGVAPAQDKGAVHNPDYRKCKKCAPALAKSMAYLKANFENPKTKRVIGSMTGGYMMSGFAFMMDGEGSSKELEKCVKHCCEAINDTGYNRNWYLGMSFFFLAEYSMKYGMTPQIQKAFQEGLKKAEEQQEKTGGWCHHLRMWAEDNYNKKGGGQDLGMINTMMFGGFMELKTLGVNPGPIADRTQKCLESISDGTGIRYGTDNNVGDAAMARASYALLGLQATGRLTHPFYAKFTKGLEQRYKEIEKGVHGYAPFHYFSVAAASHRMGPDQYRKFADEWIDKLTATQTAEGVVALQDDDVASTAVYACILMMQKDRIFFPRSARGDRPSAKSNKEEYKLGTEALAKDDYARACQHFENVVPDRDSEELVPQAREKLRKIAELSWEHFKEAETLEAAGEIADAIKAFQEVEKTFAGMPVSVEAKQKIETLKAKPGKRV
jgi:TolA-binding protein